MKIKPTIRGPKNYCDFNDLNIGDAFIHHSELCMKITDLDDDNEQCAICLLGGELYCNLCGEEVLPVDAVITWTKQKE